jgi:hypothetical protein
LPDIPGVNLQFQPSSYFRPLGLETKLLTHTKGASRRAALKQLIYAGCLVAYYEKFGRHVLEKVLRSLDAGALKPRLEKVLATGAPLAEEGSNPELRCVFPPEGCCIALKIPKTGSDGGYQKPYPKTAKTCPEC